MTLNDPNTHPNPKLISFAGFTFEEEIRKEMFSDFFGCPLSRK